MIKLYRKFKDFLRKELRVHSPTAHSLGNVDTCVACGEVVPEGRQVCPNCNERIFNDSIDKVERSLELSEKFSDIRKYCKDKDICIKIKYHNPGFNVCLNKTVKGFTVRDSFFISGYASEKDMIRFIKARIKEFEKLCQWRLKRYEHPYV